MRDVLGWSLVGVALIGGIYACYIFTAVAAPLAHMIVKIFI